MGNFNVVDLLLLLGIGQGLFLSITLPVLHNKNVAANKILALQIFLSCLMLLMRMLVHKAHEPWVVQRLAPLETLIFVVGPLGFIYLKRLLERKQARFKLSWVHYIPAGAYLAYLLFLNTYSSTEFGQKWVAGQFALPFFIAELSAIMFNLWYWFLSVRFFRKVLQEEKEQFSFTQSALLFVRSLVIASGLILTAWCISFLSLAVFRVQLPFINYRLVWIAIPVLIYIVGFFALKQPELFRVQLHGKPRNKKTRALMDQQGIDALKRRLTTLMDEERVYLDNELTLADLSKQLNTSTNNLSWLLNTVYRTNFYDYINTYRIKAFLSKLEQKEHKAKTLLSLSLEVGFNSKSTFNKAFKALLHETPSSYIKRSAS